MSWSVWSGFRVGVLVFKRCLNLVDLIITQRPPASSAASTTKYRKTSEEVDCRQYHGVDWPDAVRGCSAVTQVVQHGAIKDSIWQQRFLTKGHEEDTVCKDQRVSCSCRQCCCFRGKSLSWGSPRTNFQVLVVVLGSLRPRKFSRTE